jgi:OOP family OmpA-OmpF porin
MGKRCFGVSFILAVAGVLIFCGNSETQAGFIPQDLNAKLKTGGYIEKVDNFLVIIDASGSMGKEYEGRRKLTLAKETVSNMNQTIPDMKLMCALRRFGRNFEAYQQKTALLYGMTDYKKAGLEEAVTALNRNLGESPLALAMNAAGDDLQSAEGDMALIIVSDGKDMDDAPVEAAKQLKCRYGERLCIYTIQVGNCAAGKELLERVADAGNCGFSVNADDIASSEGMANFVEAVFLEKGDRDTDGDGVIDRLDKCPNTPKGAKVNQHGCWIIEGIYFDTDKAVIKPQAYKGLDEVVAVLKKNPGLKIEIQGHTDSTGTEEYNLGLSQRRAEAVMNYLVADGISKDRLTAKGYGLTRPVATNETAQGRAQNRRVQLNPM